MAKKKKATPSKTSPSRSSRRPIQVDMSKVPKHLHPSVKSVWADFMQLSMQKEPAPISALTFFTLLDGRVLDEACRVNMTTAHLRVVADEICCAIDYYPTRTTVAPKKKR